MECLSVARRCSSAGIVWLSLCGCSAALAPPGHGGSPWHRVTSEHFEVTSSLSAGDAEAAADELEAAYLVFDQVLFPDARPSSRRITVTLLGGGQLEQLGYRESLAGFARRDNVPLMVTDLVADASRRSQADEVLRHELAHFFFARSYPAGPLWLNEGMAEYVETLELRSDSVVVGASLLRRTQTWRTPSQRPSVGQLLSLPAEEFRSGSDEAVRQRYLVAWAIVSVLQRDDDLRKRLAAYLSELTTAEVSQTEAWEAYLGPIEDTLQGRVDELFASIRDLTFVVDVAIPAHFEMQTRELSEVESRVAWMGLLLDAGRGSEFDAELAALEQSHPDDPLMHYVRGMASCGAARTEAFAAARRARPEEVEFIYAETSVRFGSTPADPQLRQLVPLLLRHASRAEHRALAGAYLVAQGRKGRGIRELKRATDSDPSCWRCFVWLSDALEQLGDSDHAAQAFDLALKLRAHSAEEVESLLRRRKQRIEAAKQPSPVPSKPPASEPGEPDEPGGGS